MTPPIDDGHVRVRHAYRWLDPDAGGTFSAVLEVATLQAEHGWQPSFVGVRISDAGRRILGELGPVRDVASTTLDDVDLVHVHGMWSPQITRYGLAAARQVATVLSPHGTLDRWSMREGRLRKRVFLAALGSRLLSRVHVVHATAEGEAGQVRPWTRRTVVTVPLPVSPVRPLAEPVEAVRERWGMAPGATHVVYFGRLHPKKRPDLVPAVLAAAIEREPARDWRLHYVGGGEPAHVRAVEEAVSSSTVAERVTFHGFRGGADRFSVVQAADAMILPTQQENFGMVFFETLAAGCPLVTTRDIDTAGELAESGSAWVVPGTVTDLADALVEATSAESVTRARSTAPAYIAERYSPAAVWPRWRQLYDLAAQQKEPQ